jgi:hypothetical protein
MSRPFIFNFLKNYKKLLTEWTDFSSNMNIDIVSFITFSHLSYAYGTQKKREIKVKQKYQYQYTKNGFTEFMIVDDNDKHYRINNCIWYLKWDGIEDWVKINKNDVLNIKYYGLRIPMFGMFPNVISIDNTDCKFYSYCKNMITNLLITNKEEETLLFGL